MCSNYSGWFRGERETRETKAANAFQYVILGIFLVLAYGLWKLQVIESGSYASAAEKNQGDHNTPTGSSEIEEPFPFSGDPTRDGEATLALGRNRVGYDSTVTKETGCPVRGGTAGRECQPGGTSGDRMKSAARFFFHLILATVASMVIMTVVTVVFVAPPLR